jgi:hypothetical protein
MKYKLKLSTPVHVIATATVEVEGTSIEDVKMRLPEILNKMDEQYSIALAWYSKDPLRRREYPSHPCSWSVDDEDVENAVDNNDIDLDDWEEVE